MIKITNVKRIVNILVIMIIIFSTFFLVKACQRYLEAEKQHVLMSEIQKGIILNKQRKINLRLVRQKEELVRQREVNLMLKKQIKTNLMLIKQREKMSKK